MYVKNKPHLNLPPESPPVCTWYRIKVFHICWEGAQSENRNLRTNKTKNPFWVSHETLQVYVASSQNDQGSEDVLIFSDALTAPRVDRRRLHTRLYESSLVILKNSTSGLSTSLIPLLLFSSSPLPSYPISLCGLFFCSLRRSDTHFGETCTDALMRGLQRNGDWPVPLHQLGLADPRGNDQKREDGKC